MRNGGDGISQANIPENRSLREIVQDILQDVQRIVRAEIQLGRTEITQKVQRIKNASLFFGAAAISGGLAAACIVTACITALALVLPLWLAALLMGILLGAVAGAAFIMGRSRIQNVDPVPHQTVETLKGNLEWAERRTS